MEVSPALQEYAESKLTHQIEKFVTKPIEVHVTFSVDRHLRTAHVSLLGGDGFSVQVEHSCDDMYGSVDRALDKLGAQLKRKKEILKDHKQKKVRPTDDAAASDEEMAVIDAGDIVKFEAARRRA
jgi:putative sigma-54 modulation protein